MSTKCSVIAIINKALSKYLLFQKKNIMKCSSASMGREKSKHMTSILMISSPKEDEKDKIIRNKKINTSVIFILTAPTK